jgi:hypothetical protein
MLMLTIYNNVLVSLYQVKNTTLIVPVMNMSLALMFVLYPCVGTIKYRITWLSLRAQKNI